MSLAGHNKGKEWVPGVGYRFPKRKPRKKPVCHVCGETIESYQSSITETMRDFTLKNPATRIMHEKCYDKSNN